MKSEILQLANNKFKKLVERYPNFINVFVDDWRGYRFIYDTTDVLSCSNDCQNCPLFNLLKEEENELFTASLYKASKEDKEIFGKQNFLNCKTLKQYQDCFINLIIQKTFSQEEIKEELDLVRNLQLIYSRNNDILNTEREFKKKIINNTLLCLDKTRKKIVLDILAQDKYWRYPT